MERCWKIHGYPPGKGPMVVAQASSSGSQMPITQEQYDQLINFLSKQSRGEHSNHCIFGSTNTSWILDNGASNHITPHLSLFHKHKPLFKPTFITLPNGKQTTILHVGSVKLSSQITLQNVLYAPSMSKPLVIGHEANELC
ncbi:hypothetical protein V2J09_002144 [Rumex salicifolius]